MRVFAAWVGAWAVVALFCFCVSAFSRATLRSPDPSLLLQDRHGAYLGEINVPADGRLGFWSAGVVRCEATEQHCLPARIVAATVAIEDRRFASHPGVDVRAVARAIQQNLSHGTRISGASTLAMQVARLQDPGARTYPRKAHEALTALFLTARHGRDAVLAQYLRLAPYGNNVHGVRYAARRYFRKPLADLTWAEAAWLAALPQAPGKMNPYLANGRRRGTTRAAWILDLLLKDGRIDRLSHQTAVAELEVLAFGRRPARPDATLHPVLALDGQLHAEVPEVRSTLDLELQTWVEQELALAVGDWADRGAAQAAAVVFDRDTLAVRAAVGSIGFHAPQAGSIDFTRVRRYPGSTLKPLLYAAALDHGEIVPNTVLDDLFQGPEGIRNADDSFLGPLMPRAALANSRNVPAVELAQSLGLVELYDTWAALGLHDGSVPVQHYGLGIAIGGMPVRLIDLVTAYGALANDGQLRAPHWREGQPNAPHAVFTADSARLVTQWLSDPVARTPTFPRGGATEYGFPVAVKTGTSPDFRDSWAVGYSERYLVGIWVGHPDWRPMRGLGGYSGGAVLLKRVLEHLHADDAGLANVGFPAPAEWQPQTICAHTGHLATAYCDAPRTEWFPPNNAPQRTCEAHRLEAGRVVTYLPSRYARWMASAGITPALRATAGAGDTVQISVLSPRDGAQVVRDPEVPAALSTLRLAASVDPPVEQLLWLVDGVPYAVVEAPYEVRWAIEPGRHSFVAQAVLRPERSKPVRVNAQFSFGASFEVPESGISTGTTQTSHRNE